MPINRLVDKQVVGYIHNGILLDHKKNKILLFVKAQMDLEGSMLIETSQTEKDK